MKKRITRITATIAVAMLFVGPLSARAQTVTDTPFSQMIVGSCAGEDIALKGVLRTTVKRTELKDGSVRIDVKESVKEGEATGLTSLAQYQLRSGTTTRIILSSEALEAYTYKSFLQIIGPGTLSNLKITYLFKQTGEEVVLENFAAECR